MLSFTPSVATDFENTSSDMWRFLGNAVAFYTPRDDRRWISGAVVTGAPGSAGTPRDRARLVARRTEQIRSDIPTTPHSRRLADSGNHEWWGYLGSNLGGGTWAIELPGGVDDELTYRASRLVVGMDSVPPGSKASGSRGSQGPSSYLEAGISLGREIEFERTPNAHTPDDVFYVGGRIRF